MISCLHVTRKGDSRGTKEESGGMRKEEMIRGTTRGKRHKGFLPPEYRGTVRRTHSLPSRAHFISLPREFYFSRQRNEIEGSVVQIV